MLMLLADIDFKQILTAIVPLVLLVVWILSQVLGQRDAQANKARPAGNPRPRADEGGMREEIERFLREAKQQQQEPQPRQTDEDRRHRRQQEKQEKERRKQEREREAARQRARDMATRSRSVGFEPEIIEDVDVVGVLPSVSQHVSVYMDSSRVGESASHLGEDVGLSDERLAERLHQTFDHKIGNFAGTEGEVERGGAAVRHTVTSATQIAMMLRDPRNFRQALILNEVLNRPEHLWD